MVVKGPTSCVCNAGVIMLTPQASQETAGGGFAAMGH
jgi:hypothetical protein